MKTASDFVEVRLSAVGVSFAGASGSVRVANGHFAYTFTAATPVRVLTSEWRKLLSLKQYKGQPVFEVVTAESAPQAPTDPIETAASAAEIEVK